MKSSPSFGLLAAVLLCAALMSPVPADAAGPFKRLRSSLQKAGKVLNPFKREAQPPPAPAPAPLKLRAGAPVKTVKKSAPRPSSKAVPVSQKTKSATKTKKAGAAAGATALSATASSRKKSNSQEQNGEKPSDKTPEAGDKLPDKAEGETETDAEVGVETEETPAPAPEVIIRQPLAEIPFGTPVMGRKGQVRSPFAPDQGMVDVSDIPAGTRVKCPFTEKVFRVP